LDEAICTAQSGPILAQALALAIDYTTAMIGRLKLGTASGTGACWSASHRAAVPAASKSHPARHSENPLRSASPEAAGIPEVKMANRPFGKHFSNAPGLGWGGTFQTEDQGS